MIERVSLFTYILNIYTKTIEPTIFLLFFAFITMNKWFTPSMDTYKESGIYNREKESKRKLDILM